MKAAIFTSVILAASTASALHLPREGAPRAARSTPDTTVVDETNSPISKAEFTRLYNFVEELINSDDYVGLSALNFLTREALEDFDSTTGEHKPSETPAAVTKRNNRSLGQQFSNFGNFFGGGRP
ncbi:uncharacterized protein DNG_04592 [Cephalotrichum gorgonifer]|uniref:Uncharacterized protein n=1 Tax=Cephalotrichum gorgonifer TaxID=2041049 RepID=A0AAE8SV23_9PEZI|nr:uncharacterized protein DNG_04592 [Cephalotrichum gorgonifer]